MGRISSVISPRKASQRRRPLVLLIWFLSFAVFASGCGSDEPLVLSPYDEIDPIPEVWIEVDQTTLSPVGTSIIIHNTSERDDLFTGLWFCIERKEHDTWYSLPFKKDTVGFPSVDIDIPTASEIQSGFIDGLHYDSSSEIAWKRFPPNELGCLWEDLYGELPSGDYRLIICLSSKKDIPISEHSPSYYLAAPFSIS